MRQCVGSRLGLASDQISSAMLVGGGLRVLMLWRAAMHEPEIFQRIRDYRRLDKRWVRKLHEMKEEAGSGRQYVLDEGDRGPREAESDQQGAKIENGQVESERGSVAGHAPHVGVVAHAVCH